MDILAEFLSVAGVNARLGELKRGGRSWHLSSATSKRSPAESTSPAEQMVLYAIAEGSVDFVSPATHTALDSGDVMLVEDGLEHRLASRSDHVLVATASIEFTSGAIGLSAIGLAPTTLVQANGDAQVHELVKRLAVEFEQARGGWTLVALGLINALFVAALRSSGKGSCEDGGEENDQSIGWLRGMADEEIGAALKMMHAQPNHRWTVAELANELSISRSAFAARFKATTGRPPLEYLTWWRLQRAAAKLREGNVTVAEVARVSGYRSEASFGKAFRRELGISPGQYRRQAQLKSKRASQLQREIHKRDPFVVPEQEVSLNLLKTAEWMREPFVRLMNDHGLVGPQYNVLRILRGHGQPQSIDELKQQLVLPEADLQPFIEALIAKRLISCEDATSSLSEKTFLLTPSGKELLAQLDSPTMAIHHRQLAHLSEGEITELNRLLVKARNSL